MTIYMEAILLLDEKDEEAFESHMRITRRIFIFNRIDFVNNGRKSFKSSSITHGLFLINHF